MDSFALKMTGVFKALSDPTRLKIIRLVANRKEDFFVAEIAGQLGITDSAVSQHLKVLKTAGIVEPVRKGYRVFYRIDTERMESFAGDVEKFVKYAFVGCKYDGDCEGCPEKEKC